MNILYSWLKDFVSFDLTPEETADALTSIGLENGPIETVETIKGGLEGLVIGQVMTCIAHPDSDHLHITTVDVGEAAPLTIVCGAPNVAAGQKVVVATIGTKLYDGDSSFTIKRSKIRGQESFGMLCAEDEIGIGTDHAGIIVLPDDVPVGTLAKDYYHVENQAVLEVDITPNRADATSHYGVARDLAAWLKAQGKPAELHRPSVEAFQVDDHCLPISVKVENTQACPRYCGVSLTNVKIQESPKWLQDRLKTIGLHPINNVVDITNYLLHETGQPLHAFDADKIKGGEVIVKTLPEGSAFTTLDGVERKLSDKDLMICNKEEGMCMAGVFGGLDAGVTEQTTSVFLESAYFNPVWVRKTARRHGLNTDSSFRFERGVDPKNALYVLKRAALMIKELAGASVSCDPIDVYPVPVEDFKVSLSFDKCNRLIGKTIEPEIIRTILSALEIRIEEEKEGVMELLVPSYRVDVQRDVDVIEDILRIYGYNHVEIGPHIQSTLTYSSHPDSHRVLNLFSEQLTACGFNEVLNNSLTSSAYYSALTTYPETQSVKIMNALSNELSVMRQSMLFGGLENIARNRNRRQNDLKLYEYGSCYHFHPENKNTETGLSPYSEESHFALWLCGNRLSQRWTNAAEALNFYDLKAYVENLLARLGLSAAKLTIEEREACDLFKHSLVIRTRGAKTLAVLGSVQTSLLKKFDIDTEVFYADIVWPVLLQSIKNTKISYTELPKYPEVRRDLALLIDKTVRFSDIERIAYATEKKLLKQVWLFDVYEGKNLPEGKKSYAVGFLLQDENQTLTDQRIDSIMNKLITSLKQQTGASLR